jgi:hypothetical protein
VAKDSGFPASSVTSPCNVWHITALVTRVHRVKLSKIFSITGFDGSKGGNVSIAGMTMQCLWFKGRKIMPDLKIWSLILVVSRKIMIPE